MYNTKVECTYNTSEVFIEEDTISDEEKNFIRDVLYRQELLDIFDIKEYNEQKMNTAICDLYNIINDCQELKECIIKVANKLMIEDTEEFGLMILYSFDFMYLTHICVSEFLENGKITENNISKLKNKLFEN
jgi:hypothetical protein